MFGLGFQEVLLILIIALLLFGAARLPEIGRALGKSLNEFKKGLKETGEDQKENDDKESHA